MTKNEMKIASAESPTLNDLQPHLMCRKGDVAEIVLLPGDPGRVAMFVDLCDDFHIVASNREYTVGTGTYKGVPVSVCSTGIGAPSTEIAVIELIELGAKALIRIGGAGVLKEEIGLGEMVISTGAVRQGGSSIFYAPAEYPAIASYQVINSLIEACDNAGEKYWTGISASIGSFFAGQGRTTIGKDFGNQDIMDKYIQLNVLNMEMESETIMTLGSIYDVMTGCICAVHANRITNEWMIEFEEPQRKMCKIALEACKIIHDKYL